MRLHQEKIKKEKKKNIYVIPMRIVAILLLVVMLMNGSSQVFAAINEGYATESIDVKDPSDWIKQDMLAQPLGSLFLWVGGLIEWAVSRVSAIVAGGDSVMPWADAILFNAVPILDVNFINPADGSIVKALSSIIQGMYYTVLGLSITFFSIAVMLMAIRLAISSIAAEKAKYKAALVNWAISLVLLFTLHYFISFVFFLNESLVKVASNLLSAEIADSSFSLDSGNKDENIEDAVDHLKDAYKDIEDKTLVNNIEKIMKESPDYYKTMTELSKEDLNAFFGHSTLGGKFNEWTGTEWKTNTALVKKWTDFYMCVAKLPTEYKDNLKNTKTVSGQKYSVRDQYLLWIFKGYAGYLYDHPGARLTISELNKMDTSNFEAYTKGTGAWQENVGIYMGAAISNPTGGGKGGYSADEMNRLANIVITVNSTFGKTSSSGYEEGGKNVISNGNKMPITMMAQYFRKNAYMPSSDKSLVAEDVYLPNCIMYLIFVIQSMLYFFSYMKRMFYVIVLALLGPVIIVFDFFMKG